MQLLKMTDALNVKNRGIPLKIEGATRFVRGATKYTTTSDVIKMVLKKTGIVKEYRHLFAIYELSKEGEMLVPGKTRILKLIESWNFEPNKLVLRKTDPLGHLQVSSVTTNNLFQKKTQEQPSLQKEVIKPEEKYTPLDKVANFAQKQRMTRQNEPLKDKKEIAESSSSGISTSCSDSSLENFFEKVDQSKLAGFIEFFNAIKIHRDKRCKPTCSDNQVDSVYDQHSKPCSRFNRRTSRQSNSHFKRCHKHRTVCSKGQNDSEVHPKKMYSIKTVDYGLVDGYNYSNALNLTNASLLHDNNISSQNPSKRTGSKFQNAKHVLPLSKTTGSIGARLFSKTRRRSELSSDDDSVLLNSYRSINTDGFDSFYNCQKLSGANIGMEEQHDSGHDDVMYSDPETAVLEDSKFDHLYSSIISSPSSSYHKLVDYSVTDDEACDDDVFTEQDDVLRVSNISRVIVPLEGALADDENSETSFGSSNTSGHESLRNGLCYNNQGFIENDDDQLVDIIKNNRGNISVQYGNNINNDVHNISNVSDYIRSIFGNKFVANEDDGMDSFMNSEVSSDDSFDEELSSMEGGLENDIRL